MTEQTPKKIGRPSKFTQALADDICERIATGEGMREICRGEGFPVAEKTVFEWLQKDAQFRKQYTRAREEQADTYADEVIIIADGVEARRTIDKKDADGNVYQVEVEEDPNRSRLRMDARKWAAGKRKPKVYGDRMHLDHTHSYSEMPTGELVDVIKAMSAKLGIDLPEGFGTDVKED